MSLNLHFDARTLTIKGSGTLIKSSKKCSDNDFMTITVYELTCPFLSHSTFKILKLKRKSQIKKIILKSKLIKVRKEKKRKEKEKQLLIKNEIQV